MKLIQLANRELFTKVDDDDFERLSAFSWYLCRGYAQTNRLGKILMHTLIMQPPDGYIVDHINRVRLDNQRHNLRVVTRSQNTYNSRMRIDNKSGFRGVSYYQNNGTWRAGIGRRFLGYFRTAEEAAYAYDEAAKQIVGPLALLNFPS